MIKVIIIEDDPMVRDINIKFLNKVEGFTLVGATGDLEEARIMMGKYKPQLLLLDVFLPKGNGIEFLKNMRKDEVKCDVMLITADRTMEAVEEAFRYGAIDYLVKPFVFQRFKEALCQYKVRYESLNSIKRMEQEEIDKYMLNSSEASNLKEEEEEERELCKGLNHHTYNQILEHVNLIKDFFTAEQVAEELGLARVTVRRYLEFMYKENRLLMEMEYGRVGRPGHKYKLNN